LSNNCGAVQIITVALLVAANQNNGNQNKKKKPKNFRPFVSDPMEETNIPQPERQLVSYHDISEVIEPPQQATYSTLEKPKQKKADVMYCRPGFDNVPSY
uniref:Reverse transcriptase domain-containing protein n=1 Tax=Enterobius vermicularis TaxID=51028 RepID=A0A0N4VIS3_ENTVE